MMKHHFSLKEAFVFGFDKAKQHYWFCALTFLLALLIINTIDPRSPLVLVVTVFMALSLAYVSLLIVRDQHFSFESLFAPLLSPKRVIKFTILAVLYSIPLLSLIALYQVQVNASQSSTAMYIVMLPLIYIIVRMKFFPFIVIEHDNDSILRLLKLSFGLTRRHFSITLLLCVIVGGINALGMYYTALGLIFTLPISLFTVAYAYTRLKEHIS